MTRGNTLSGRHPLAPRRLRRRVSAWDLRGRSLPLGKRTLLMGVVNVTPDSFSDGGRHDSEGTAFAHGMTLWREGADVLDVGGESTRPGAQPVDAAEELRRALPVVRRLVAEGCVVSVDTSKAEVARACLDAGAHCVNDVTAGRDPDMFHVVAEAGAGLVLMHMQGEPRTMQESPSYQDVVKEVAAFLQERARAAEAAGVARSRIVLDPGIGFGKDEGHNLRLLHATRDLAALGYPLMVGASRKRFIASLTAEGSALPSPQDRLEGTLAAHLLARERGASILRVHDVRAHRRAFAVADRIREGA